MPEGGKLVIETFRDQIDSGAVGVDAPAGSYAVLRIADTGKGMDAETQDRIFDPFFTTKAVGRGSGVGLSTVYGIVSQSDGYIGVTSAPGAGTTFSIYLPANEGQAQDLAEHDSVDRVAGGSERVLLVEDDGAVREVSRSALEAKGYRVQAAESAEHAICLVTDAFAPDLLITDVVMPGESGLELADRLQAEHPELHLLFISGYAEDSVLSNPLVDPLRNLLSKPFTPDQLLRKVREVLDSE